MDSKRVLFKWHKWYIWHNFWYIWSVSTPGLNVGEILEIQILAISPVAILSQQNFTQFPGTRDCGAQIKSSEVKAASTLRQMCILFKCVLASNICQHCDLNFQARKDSVSHKIDFTKQKTETNLRGAAIGLSEYIKGNSGLQFNNCQDGPSYHYV